MDLLPLFAGVAAIAADPAEVVSAAETAAGRIGPDSASPASCLVP